MKKNIFVIFYFILCIHFTFAQTTKIQGLVKDTYQIPVKYATVWISTHTEYHTETDSLGKFSLTLPDTLPNSFLIIASQVGYVNDTLVFTANSNAHFVNIVLKPLSMNEIKIVAKQDPTLIGTLPIRNEVITEKEFKRAACCNVSESFETNPSVDVSLSDAVSGIRQISLLGLSGKYTLTTIENLPFIRGINIFSGFADVPATWVRNISISKGTGSVIQGYESITGQINLDFQSPELTEDKVYLNGYVNHLLRSELNANAKYTLHKNVSAMTLLHTSIMDNDVDQNQDGFMDMSMHKRITGIQRWLYQPNEKWEIRAGIRGGYEYRKNGQIHNENHNHSSMYQIDITNQRIDYFLKAGRIFEKKGRSLGLLYSGIYHNQAGKFGIYSYSGMQNMANFQAIYEEPLHKNHLLKLSAQYRYEEINEKNSYLSYERGEHTFGLIAEHTWKIHKHTILTGIRTDYHTLFGWIFTPRLHTQWALSPNTTFRTVIGKGTRISNIITENFPALASNRIWILKENLKPEIGWNMGAILDQKFTLWERKGRASIENFYTLFIQQVVEDYDYSPQMLVFYNLTGKSYAFYVQTEIEYELVKNFNMKLAYKYYDVQLNFEHGFLERPFVAKHRGLATLSYLTTNEKWQFDATLQYHGRQRLPNTKANPIEYQRPAYAPEYYILLAQAQFISQKQWEIYLGGENLLNIRQSNPIISASDPYSAYFDTTLIYAPVVGRIVYLGIRWKW